MNDANGILRSKQRIRKVPCWFFEDKLNTDNLQLMPDGTIRLYDHLDNTETVAKILSDAHILVTGLHISGDTLEDYFLKKVGGKSHE